MTLIPLTNGGYAKIDEQDLERVRHLSWYRTSHGYASAYWKGHRRQIYLHQLVMGVPDKSVDHANHDKLDCTRSNLRVAGQSNNGGNQVVQTREKSSEFKGVCWDKTHECWIAQIKKDYRVFRIGAYPRETQAAHAYDVMALKLFGEYALTNFERECYDRLDLDEELARLKRENYERLHATREPFRTWIGDCRGRFQLCMKWPNMKKFHLGMFATREAAQEIIDLFTRLHAYALTHLEEKPRIAWPETV